MKLILSLLLALLSLNVAAQNAATAATDTLPPYLTYPTLPAFFILNADSTSSINTYDIPEGQYTVLLFFSPDCEHCKALTKEMTASIDSFQDVAFYMFTPLRLELLRGFIKEQHLKDYGNIAVGKDQNFFFPGFFRTRYVPHLAIYDEKKKYVTSFEGNFKWDEVAAVLKKRP